MERLLAILLGTFVALLFAVANSHHVELSLIFGAPVRMRMIFLLAGTFVAGVISTIVFQGYRELRRQREERNQKMRSSPVAGEGEDLLEIDD